MRPARLGRPRRSPFSSGTQRVVGAPWRRRRPPRSETGLTRPPYLLTALPAGTRATALRVGGGRRRSGRRRARPRSRTGIVIRARRAMAARHPLIRRLTGYSAGSVIAAATAELLSWGVWLGARRHHLGVGRRLRGRGGAELHPQPEVGVAGPAGPGPAGRGRPVHGRGGRQLPGGGPDHPPGRGRRRAPAGTGAGRTALLAGAYLAVSGLFFAPRSFALYERVVFRAGPDHQVVNDDPGEAGPVGEIAALLGGAGPAAVHRSPGPP